jgi:ribonuclease P protein component
MPSKPVFLKTEQDFANFKKSRSLVSANFRFLWHFPLKKAGQKDQNFPRFGFIVPKKTVKKVTDRNLIKRRVKTVVAKHFKKMRPVDVLFFPKPGTIKLKFPDLEREVVGLFKKAGIL